MTDNEIISIDEAIRHCYETYFERDDLCRECREEHKQLAKWLEELKEIRNTINRQKAEIERLNEKITAKDESNYYFMGQLRLAREKLLTAKSEAIKEFAERICNGRVSNDPVVIAVRTELECIKEMTEVSE